MNELLLLSALLIPLLAIAGILAAHRHPNLREGISIVAGVILFAVVLALYTRLQAGEVIGFRLIEFVPGLEIAFLVEPLGLLFAMLASFLWFTTIIYAIGYMRGHGEENQTRFYSFFALAIAAVMAIAFAENLLTLFVFYEVLTLCTYPLVTHAGTEKARKGGQMYLGILLSTSIVFLLTGIIATWATAENLSFVQGGVFSAQDSPLLLSAILLLLVFGIGKAAIMPFHRWLPAAMVAPTPVSALLHAVAVVKAGVFSVLKVCVFIFGIDTLQELPATKILLYLAGFSAVAASLIAMRKQNLKARLAYSTVGQLAYITLGALLATQTAAIGSAMHILMHGFGKITLFFCAGAVFVTHHKTEVNQLVGIGRKMPITMAAFLIGSLAIIGLPPTGGIWSKWMLLTGALESGEWLIALVLLSGSLLAIGYLIPIVIKAFFPGDADAKKWQASEMQEAPIASIIAMVITSLGCILLFLYADVFFDLAQSGIQG